MIQNKPFAEEVSPEYKSTTSFKNIVWHDEFLIFPAVSSCTALAGVGPFGLCGAHLTLASGLHNEVPAILAQMASESSLPSKLFLIGFFDGNLYSYLKSFREYCPLIMAHRLEAGSNNDILFIKEGFDEATIWCNANSRGTNHYRNASRIENVLDDAASFLEIKPLPI